jgi:ABC-type transport system involved in cytochrome c biogenesis permease component
MQYLPIVERELRVASRQARTWWRRGLTACLGMVLLGACLAFMSQWSNVNRLGPALFAMLGGFGMVYALLAGPLWTADTLARERREGTLGLLFLTNLRSYDVVLGKLGAGSLDTLLALLAAVPLAVLPVLLGGVTLIQAVVLALSVVNLLFFSLATGACASALYSSGRAAIGLTLAWLSFLTIGLPLLGELFGVYHSSQLGPYFYMFCPLFTMERTLSNTFSWPDWPYWLNLGGLHALGWVCLWIACRRTARSWRTDIESPSVRRWSGWMRTLTLGNIRARFSWRERMLQRNPVAWLEGRDALQTRILTGLMTVATAVWFLGGIYDPNNMFDDDGIVLWGILAHYTLCVWIAIQSPRRMADDKQSGALELLLCSPVTPRQVVHGLMLALRARFGRILLWLLALNTALVWAYVTVRHGRSLGFNNDLVQIGFCALLVCPVQAYAFARVGIYQGLAQGNSIRATLILIAKLGLLPWVLFIGGILLIESNRTFFRSYISLNDEVVFGYWTLCHLGVCLAFLAHANRHLSRNFRSLAVHSGLQRWQQWLLVPGRLRDRPRP